MGSSTKESILLCEVQPAMQSAPKRLIYDWTKILEKDVTASCTAAGKPSLQMLPNIFLFSRIPRHTMR